jgi:SAM-dependent methyltransferase
MGIYREPVHPRLIDRVLGDERMVPHRARVVEQIRGVVCEIGFGSGTNVALYPESCERVYAVDPSPVAWRLAEARVASSSVPIEPIGLDGASLPLGDATVDTVLSTWTMCTIPDLDRALREVERVLRPGGQLVFLEHGLSDDARVAQRQRRFEPIQRRIAGGCHLTRDMTTIVGRSGLELGPVDRFVIERNATFSSMYAGTATKPA